MGEIARNVEAAKLIGGAVDFSCGGITLVRRKVDAALWQISGTGKLPAPPTPSFGLPPSKTVVRMWTLETSGSRRHQELWPIGEAVVSHHAAGLEADS